MKATTRIAFLAALGFIAACTGVIADPSSDSAASTGGTSGSAGGTGAVPNNAIPQPDADGNLPYTAPTAVSAALPARTWKLTHEQYRLSILDFLGVDVPIVDDTGASLLEPEINSGVFRNMAQSGFVSVALAEDYHTIAEDVTAALTDDQLNAQIPCGRIDVACRDEFLQSAIGRAFRRPASAEDVTRFAALFDLANGHAATLADPAAGFRAVLRALLTSPYFLYRTEIGVDAAQQDFSLTDFEVASFLSYSVLGRPPSADLLSAAERGELRTAESLRPVLESLLGAPEAADQLREFMQEWLEVFEFGDAEVVRKDLASFESVRSAMLEETQSFLAQHGGFPGNLTGLLTSPLPLPSGALGTFYLSEPTGAAADQTRTGVLALGTVLATNAKEGATSPTLRGLFLRERLLCQDFVVPQFVPDIGETLQREQPQTTRELYELHAAVPSCAVCHKLIDGVGITFESLDEAGRFRSAQNGVAIDTSGRLLNTDVNTELRDHAQLAQALAQSEWVRECMSRQAFRFYFGLATAAERRADGTRERENRGLPPIQDGRVALSGSGTIRDLVTAVLSSPSTLARTRFEPPPADQ